MMLKSRMNRIHEELTRTKTRNAILQEQLKAKDKFADELLQSTFKANQARGKPNAESSHPGSTKNFPGTLAGSGPKGERPYSVLKLRKQVNDLRELVQNKTQENEELKGSVK